MITRFLVLALMISCSNLFGKIRNGYESRLQGYKASLESLKLKLSEGNHFSIIQSARIKSQIKDLINLISYCELTQKLIEQLKIVTPAIYNDLDTIKDKKGRLTDVFIKLIPREHARIQLTAASFFTQAAADEDASVSQYGKHTVSVDIWLSEHSLFLLCHELGHIKYVVPNLASYSRFYKKYYRGRMNNLSYIGHSNNDQSGKSAKVFEKQFFADQAVYLKLEGNKPESAIAMMQEIRKKNKSMATDSALGSAAYVNQYKSPGTHQFDVLTVCNTFSNFELILKGYEKSSTLPELNLSPGLTSF
ncbi:MAG: hypothetical protein C0490_23320 [Marivirga sp.]|nr:hypothetical protein [Marivirga sp.]